PWPMPRHSDEAMNKAILERSQTGFHPCGTCRLGKDIEQGVSAVTIDGNTMFMTRWEANTKSKFAAIYSSSKSDKGWSNPTKLAAPINVDGASSQQPSVSPDGKFLFFSSNRAGGIGGFDIWYAPIDETGKPGEPVNAGASVNSDFDDQAPYYHAPSQALIFSSKGRVGMGGYDFFQSKGAIGTFAPATNLGYPVNSIKDDIYLVSKGGAKNMLENVMLSSDRDAACCLELFHLVKVRPLKQISGQVVSCDRTKPLPGGTLAIIDPATNKTLYSANVGADGKYQFALEDFQQFKVEASAKGYITNNLTVQAPSDLEDETQTTPVLCLLPEPPKVNETFVVKNVYYEYDKSEVKPES
ncbi:MAG: flagellar motor protein MotB, partial [Pedobacter sp.]